MRDSIFISYSHKDHKFLEELQSMLKPLKRSGKVDPWDDTKIRASAKWQDEIDNALKNAKAAVLLVSKSFLDSDFIANHELPPLLKAAEQDGLKIFWVCLGNCLYEQTEINDYQAIYDIKKPLKKMTPSERDDVWKKISEELEMVPSLPSYLGPSDTGIGSMGIPLAAPKKPSGMPARKAGSFGRLNPVGNAEVSVLSTWSKPTSITLTGNQTTEEIKIEDVDPLLLKMVVDILDQSKEATEQLANDFGLEYETIDDCREKVARKAVTTPLYRLVDLARECQVALRMETPPKKLAAAVIATFMAMVFPAQDSARRRQNDSGGNGDWRNDNFQLLVSRATLAEIRMAALDKRLAQFIFIQDGKHKGKGHFGEAEPWEVGRDPNWIQFEKDLVDFLCRQFEDKFDQDWRLVTNKSFRDHFEERKGMSPIGEDEWLKNMISRVIEAKARDIANKISEDSGIKCKAFTFYFLIKTPIWMTQEEITKQDAVLQKLRTWFTPIAFLRLTPETEESALDMLPFLNLRKLLNPNEGDI